MDDSTLRKGMQALEWEANYRRRGAQETSNHFLAPTISLDVDFETHIVKHNVATGRALDVGTGTGEQAIFLARNGFEVTGTDVSPTALESARSHAMIHKVIVNFIEDNILNTQLTDQFDLIIDRGCFTILPANYRLDYLQAIKKLLKVNGWFFLKADKKKKVDVNALANDPCFKIVALDKSSYPAINNKIIPAVVLFVQRIL